jgi:hypothetical protein
MEKNTNKYRLVPLDSIPHGSAVSVEFECIISISKVSKLLEQCNLTRYNNSTYFDQIIKICEHLELQVSVTSDPSIRPKSCNDLGVEFRITFDITNPQPFIRTFDLLKEMFDTKVSPQCGGHIHIDCRNIQDRKTVVNRVAKFIPFIYSLLPKRRVYSNYCSPTVSYGGKYAGINMHPVFNTIEFRVLEGTLDQHRILTMAKLFHMLVHTPTLSSTFNIKNNITSILTHMKPIEFVRTFNHIRRTSLKKHLQGESTSCPILY